MYTQTLKKYQMIVRTQFSCDGGNMEINIQIKYTHIYNHYQKPVNNTSFQPGTQWVMEKKNRDREREKRNRFEN